MNWDSPALWCLLIAAPAADLLIPFLLAPAYEGYSHSTMVMSVLGSGASPRHSVYNLWMGLLGAIFCVEAFNLFFVFRAVSTGWSVTLLVTVLGYALLDCVVSCFFKVGNDKSMNTTAEKLHGYGSAVGSTLFLVAPLALSVLLLKSGDLFAGYLSGGCFVLGLAAFTLFIAGDKPQLRDTVVAREGLWQRIWLLFSYLPFAVFAVTRLLGG